MHGTSTEARSSGRLASTFFVTVVVLGVLWSLATPVMGVPDENFHVWRAAALVRGDLVSSTSTSPDGRQIGTDSVPETLGRLDIPCFAFGNNPGCERPVDAQGDVLIEVESRAGRYNPLYYALVGLPTLYEPGRNTVYLMRLVTVLLVAGLLALGALALTELPSPRWAVVGLAAAVTPMVMFLAGAVNPNGVEIAAGVGLWATLLVWLRDPTPDRNVSRSLRAAALAATLVMPRGIGPLFLALIVAGAALAATPGSLIAVARRRSTQAASLFAAAATAAALGWTVSASSVSFGDGGYPQYENVRRYVYDLVNQLADYQRQMIGVFGWLDTPAQEHVYIGWFAVLGLLVLGAVAAGPTRTRVLLALLVLATVVVPLVVQFPVAPESGLIWQGRYLLPLMVGLPLAAGVALASSASWSAAFRGPWALWSVLGVIGVAHVTSFWWALHRNVIGLSEAWIGFDPLWQPPLGWIPLTIVYTAATGGYLAVLAAMARVPDSASGVSPATRDDPT